MVASIQEIEMPVVRDPRDFDKNSGVWLERLVFNHRLWLALICAVLSVFFGYQATKLKVNASFERMIAAVVLTSCWSREPSLGATSSAPSTMQATPTGFFNCTER